MEKMKGNQLLVKEIEKRFNLIRDAVEQMNRFNYGAAYDKLRKVLNESFEIEVMD